MNLIKFKPQIDSNNLEWIKLEGDFSPRVKLIGNKLIIDPYRQYYDSGFYVCVGFNGKLSSNSSVFLENQNEVSTRNVKIKITKLPLEIGDEKIIELKCNPGNLN